MERQNMVIHKDLLLVYCSLLLLPRVSACLDTCFSRFLCCINGTKSHKASAKENKESVINTLKASWF